MRATHDRPAMETLNKLINHKRMQRVMSQNEMKGYTRDEKRKWRPLIPNTGFPWRKISWIRISKRRLPKKNGQRYDIRLDVGGLRLSGGQIGSTREKSRGDGHERKQWQRTGTGPCEGGRRTAVVDRSHDPGGSVSKEWSELFAEISYPLFVYFLGYSSY